MNANVSPHLPRVSDVMVFSMRAPLNLSFILRIRLADSWVADRKGWQHVRRFSLSHSAPDQSGILGEVKTIHLRQAGPPPHQHVLVEFYVSRSEEAFVPKCKQTPSPAHWPDFKTTLEWSGHMTLRDCRKPLAALFDLLASNLLFTKACLVPSLATQFLPSFKWPWTWT